jgi:ribosomal protein S18 acetylase RimI-like enzyme
MLDIHPMRRDELAAILDIAHTAGWARAFKDDYASMGGRAEHHDVRVATVEGQVAGFCEGRFGSDFTAYGAPDHCPVPHAFVGFLAVHQTHRRAGIGRALLLSYAADAKARGCSFLGLRLDESGDDAQRLAFFQSLGLTMVNTRSHLWGAPIIDLV